jgi:hypothetical protein
MKTYEPDSSAGALLLYDFGEVEITYAGTNLSYLRRIKILNKSALNDWVDVTLLVQKLGHTKIYGYTANLENGQVVKTQIGESQIFRTNYDKYWDVYTFTMPNVKLGTVIEYTWKTVLDFYSLPTWKFQRSIPVLWSEYDLKNPILSFRADVSGLLKVDYQAPKGKKPHRWTVAAAPAFKEEPYMPNDDRLRTQVDQHRPGTEPLSRIIGDLDHCITQIDPLHPVGMALVRIGVALRNLGKRASSCIYRAGCQHPSVCEGIGVCVPGGETPECSCNLANEPGAKRHASYCAAGKTDENAASQHDVQRADDKQERCPCGTALPPFSQWSMPNCPKCVEAAEANVVPGYVCGCGEYPDCMCGLARKNKGEAK